ncbi:glycerophosphodiester phosphodiesterase family protein [Polycladidibacter hongkongensis]|uniref:glycerophosphodiester phosphodiesterase family protein n=1 Tax=Polycladidibacter hongkongensis TaxID=1647556 RepID=UPI00082D5C64|nr:glycerophosphodiester phosphodiesterase family protein [Pseudovibrio hongkongensis]
MTALPWLTARPIAHRGLHDKTKGVIENSRSAVKAAIADEYAIEVDLQETADGQAVVFHDETLERLTGASGATVAKPLAELQEIQLDFGENTARATDKIWSLAQLLELTAGRTPLIIELKSLYQPDGQPRFLAHVAELLSAYQGHVAVKSFDPAMLRAMRRLAPHIPRGALSMSRLGEDEKRNFSLALKLLAPTMLHMVGTKPSFVSYRVHDLPALGPQIYKYLFGLPIMTWTVRTADDRIRAERFADQMVFEGFTP